MRLRCLIVLLLISSSLFAANLPVTINVNAAASRHPIDPNIYGAAFASQATVDDLGITLNRWGGNASSRHNWQINASNRAMDFYFENLPDGGSTVPGAFVDGFIDATRAGGATPVITIPMIGWTPKDRDFHCSFPDADFPGQQSYDGACGNGKRGPPPGTRVFGANPSDTSVVSNAAFQAGWVSHLVGKYGPAATTGVRYYSYDNEPSLWSFSHWDVHPNGPSSQEITDDMIAYGSAIRAADPGAILTGPEEWGWDGYFYSGADQEQLRINGTAPERAGRGGVPYGKWLLRQMRAYDVANNGTRLLDYFTLHFYPQGGEFDSGIETTAATQAKRNRSTRSLWDPAYVDESWIGDSADDMGRVRLIPRMKEWVQAEYPGTKIGVTEYNWGAEAIMNGATAQADILGIFGRENVDMAVRWVAPTAGWPVYNAFKLYRNYDGAHSGFGNISVSAGGPNPDDVATFAAVRSSDHKLTIVIVCKAVPGDTRTATVNLSGFTSSGPAQRFELSGTGASINEVLPAVSVAGGSLTLTLPSESVTLLVVPGSTVPEAPANVVATAGDTTASVSFTAPNDGGAIITNYMVISTPGSITGTGNTSPITVNGLTNGVSYTFTVSATNSIGTGPESASSNSVIPGASSPAISGFSPIQGGTNTRVLVNGTNLGGVSGVAFNGVAAASFTILSPTQIRAVVPAGASTGPISVSSPGGPATSAASFSIVSQAGRSFVSTSGNDSNTCSLTAPCRSFARALELTLYDGEIVALKSGGYGPVTIDKSVTITVPEGIYAGITANAGAGITIAATPGDIITVRGLTISNGSNAANGILVSNGASVFVDRTVINGFGASGVAIISAGRVDLYDVTIRGSFRGVRVEPVNGTAEMTVTHSRIEDGSTGVDVATGGRVTLKQVLVARNATGVLARGGKVFIDRCSITGGTTGLMTSNPAPPMPALIFISRSTISDNNVAVSAAAGADICSLGNNTLSNNTAGEDFPCTVSSQ